MSDKYDGGSAFPIGDMHGEGGMTLRDYFAAAVLPAVIAEYANANGPCIGTDHFLKNVPIHAYRMADAMLKERTK